MLLLSRNEAYAIRELVTVAPVTTRIRHIPSEVPLGLEDGLPQQCVVNLDTITTIAKRSLHERLTTLSTKKLKEVDDTVGQNQRSVGKYSKAWEGLNSTLGKLGVIAILVKSFEFLSGVFSDNREGALALEIAFSKLTVSAKVFINSFIESRAY